MNIGIVTMEYPPTLGGVGQSVRRIAKGLANRNNNITVIVLPNDFNNLSPPHLDQHKMTYDGNVRVFNLLPAKYRPLEDFRNRDTACFEWICDFVFKEKLDILHSFYISHTGFITGLAAYECNIPFIASVRGNDLHQNLFNTSQFQYIKWTLKNADIITFVSKSLERRALNLCDIPGKTRVIWNSVDKNEFNNMHFSDNSLNFGTKFVLACAGEFRRKKGIERLFEACGNLKFPIGILLIGDFNWAEQEYWKTKILPSLPSNIELKVTGIIPHEFMLNYYSLANLVVFPALHDGCPNSLLEAMLAKRPIICTNVGAMGDIVNLSNAGIVINQCNSEELAKEIELLLLNMPLRKELSRNGYNFVINFLTPEKEIDTWLNCYIDLLEIKN